MCPHCLETVQHTEGLEIDYRWYKRHLESRWHRWWWKIRRRWIKFVYR